jgi:toxin ParE1/3/4
MKLVYSRRALADLNAIATYYTAGVGPLLAETIGRRLESVVDRICRVPEASPRVARRSQVRAATVVRYPFRIFYRVRNDTVENSAYPTHIEATSRN